MSPSSIQSSAFRGCGSSARFSSTSFTPFARENLGGTETVVTFLLAVFSIGIGVGSLACERLSGRRVEIGLVPLGSIGMTIFAIDLYFASTAFRPMESGGLAQFLETPGAGRIVLDLALLALFSGLYSVPLYALIQTRADKSRVARIVAANNILNAVFMVVASLMATALLGAGLTIPQLFLVTALMNAAVALYIYRLVPEFLLRFLAWVLVHTLYRVRSINTDSLPEVGAAVLACNHVSFVDAVVIMGESPRPIRFVMDHRIFKIPLINWFFKTCQGHCHCPGARGCGHADARQRTHRCGTGGRRPCLHLSGRQDHRERGTESVQTGRAAHR